MKYLLAVILFASIFFFTGVSAELCNPSVTLLNQDPYPAVPGDYVKLVFQATDLDNPECKSFDFELVPDYPLEFDPGYSGLRSYQGFNYLKDYQSNLLIPYEVRINENALDGTNDIEVRFQNKNGEDAEIFKTIELEVKESRVDFEVDIKNYDYVTHELTLEILNTGDSDIKALAVDIPKQKGIDVKGSYRTIVGDLDSNDYTTADFEAIPKDGAINLRLLYTDSIDVRREVNKTVVFDSSYFTGRIADKKTTSKTTYVLYLIIILGIIWFIRKKRKKKKR